jgi:single-stranded-DNA-specific exonuclease
MDQGSVPALADYPPIFQQILYNRGIVSSSAAEDYLYGTNFVHPDPFLLSGMVKAVDRIMLAINRNEKMIVYGDYDVDGVTATALLVELLKSMGAEVEPYIPDRFEEGYGLNKEALQSFVENGIKLAITVDCGIRSMGEAEFAKAIGLDLIITDHHHPLDEIPDAFAVINPKQKGDEYPYKELAGVGVAFKLAQAILTSTGAADDYAERWLDLVALGTVADLAPLIGENRALVRAGLQVIRTGRRKGLHALSQVAGLSIANTSASDIGFTLGPRLNAAGRLTTAMAAYSLLVCGDPEEAPVLAQSLNKSNTERQEITRETQQKAVETVMSRLEMGYMLFVVDPEFNEGIVGLVASRLTDQFYRPSIVGKKDVETTRCSCRSIPEFHITNALDECRDLLVRHGGHAAAAGFTVRNENLDELITRLQNIAHRVLCDLDLVPTLHADVEVSLKDLDMNLFKYLELLQPFGYGNQEPYFISRKVKVREARLIGTEKKHLKLKLQEDLLTLDAIAFNFGHLYSSLTDQVDILYIFEKNLYNGYVNMQLRIKDIHPMA